MSPGANFMIRTRAQGRTVDRAVLVVDEQTGAEGLYVGMSRGRLNNQAVAIDGSAAEAADMMAAATQRPTASLAVPLAQTPEEKQQRIAAEKQRINDAYNHAHQTWAKGAAIARLAKQNTALTQDQHQELQDHHAREAAQKQRWEEIDRWLPTVLKDLHPDDVHDLIVDKWGETPEAAVVFKARDQWLTKHHTDQQQQDQQQREQQQRDQSRRGVTDIGL